MLGGVVVEGGVLVVPGLLVGVVPLVPVDGTVLPGTQGLATVAEVPLGCELGEVPVPVVVELPIPVEEVGPLLDVVDPVVVLLVPLVLHGPVMVPVVLGVVVVL